MGDQHFWHHDTKEHRLAICVCDGAGSARLSRVGAYVVAAEVTNALITQEGVCDESMKSALRAARSKLDRWAGSAQNISFGSEHGRTGRGGGHR